MSLYTIQYLLICVILIAKSSLADIQLGSCSLSCDEHNSRANRLLHGGAVGPPGKAGSKGSRGFPGLNGLKGDQGSPGAPCACPSYDVLSRRLEAVEKDLAVLNMNGWTKAGNNLWYKMTESTSNYATAKAKCESMNARLTSTGLRNPIITRKIYGIIGGHVVWIGLDDIQAEGRWMWSDGVEDTGSSLWSPGEPNNSGGIEDCAIAFRNSGNLRLGDRACSASFKGLCERSV